VEIEPKAEVPAPEKTVPTPIEASPAVTGPVEIEPKAEDGLGQAVVQGVEDDAAAPTVDVGDSATVGLEGEGDGPAEEPSPSAPRPSGERDTGAGQSADSGARGDVEESGKEDQGAFAELPSPVVGDDPVPADNPEGNGDFAWPAPRPLGNPEGNGDFAWPAPQPALSAGARPAAVLRGDGSATGPAARPSNSIGKAVGPGGTGAKGPEIGKAAGRTRKPEPDPRLLILVLSALTL